MFIGGNLTLQETPILLARKELCQGRASRESLGRWPSMWPIRRRAWRSLSAYLMHNAANWRAPVIVGDAVSRLNTTSRMHYIAATCPITTEQVNSSFLAL